MRTQQLYCLLVSASLYLVTQRLAIGSSFTSYPSDASSLATTQQRKISPPRLIVAGAIKNDARHLVELCKTIARIVVDFELVKLVIYENDSTDNTLEILETWRNEFPLLLLSERNVTGGRTVSLAHARNTLWREITKLSDPIDHVLMIDMDEVNYHLSGVPDCFRLPDDWSVCCANQYTMYYDLWPLRAKGWLECDWLLDCPRFDLDTKLSFFRHISASEAPVLVDSCFGGAALYRYSHLQGLNLTTYSGSFTQWSHRQKKMISSFVCEHWPFHHSLHQQKSSLKWYIQPKFLNDGPDVKNFEFKKAVSSRRPDWEASHRNPELSKYYDIFKT